MSAMDGTDDMTPLETAEKVKRLYASLLFTQRDICEITGLSPASVSLIIRGRRWKDAKWPNGTDGAIDPTLLARARRDAYLRSNRRKARKKES